MKWILIAIMASSLSLSAGELTVLRDNFQFTEGPAAETNGAVFFTDVRAARIYVLRPDGSIELFRENSGGANGLYMDAGGNLLACEGDNQRLTSTSPDGQITVIAEQFDGKPFNKPNDLWIDPAGGVYFSDPAYGRTETSQDGEHVYYLRPDRSEVIRVVSDFVRPNGLIGTPDGKTLYVADHGDAKVWRYSIRADGRLNEKTLFVKAASDGMTLDAEGNLYVTQDSVLVFNPAGEQIHEITTPSRPTNVTFSKDGHTLYVTARSSFCKVDMDQHEGKGGEE